MTARAVPLTGFELPLVDEIGAPVGRLLPGGVREEKLARVCARIIAPCTLFNFEVRVFSGQSG